MPKGPEGRKRPADAIGNAVRVMEIAIGQRDEEYEAATELGRKSGKPRRDRLAPERRAEIAREAVRQQ